MSYVFLPDEPASSSQQPKSAPPDYLWKILMQGDSGVGKSSLMLRYVDDAYSENYISSVGIDFRIKAVRVGDKTANLQIWDTAGQEKYRTIQSNYYSGLHAVILNFDLNDKISFDNAKLWLEQIKSNKDFLQGVIIMLSGNKSDLDSKRVILPGAVKDFIESWNAANEEYQIKGYVETSAKMGTSVSQLFEVTAEAIMHSIKGASDDPFNVNTVANYENLFHQQHDSMRQKEFFKFFRHTDIKGDENLSEILSHAVKSDNRSRKACVKLEWLNKDGSLAQGAPELIRQNYPGSGDKSLEGSCQKNKF